MRDDNTWAEGLKKTNQGVTLSIQINSVQTQLKRALTKIKTLESNNNTPASGTKPGAKKWREEGNLHRGTTAFYIQPQRFVIMVKSSILQGQSLECPWLILDTCWARLVCIFWRRLSSGGTAVGIMVQAATGASARVSLGVSLGEGVVTVYRSSSRSIQRSSLRSIDTRCCTTVW